MAEISTSWPEINQTSYLHKKDMFSLVTCPERLNAAFVLSLNDSIQALISKQPFVLLELEKTSFIDTTGLSWLINLSKVTSQSSGGLYLKGVKPSLIRFFKLNRVWDLFQKKILNNVCELNNIIKSVKNNPAFYSSFESKDSYTIIRLFGRLDANAMNSDRHSLILKYIPDNHCIFDLNKLDFIDSTGLTLFIKILKLSSISQKQCILYGLNHDIGQMFTITKVINLFTIVADFPSAIKKIEK